MIKFQNYEFVYMKADSVFAKALVAKVTGSLKKIENFFGYQPGSMVTIFLTRSEAEYLSYARAGIPEWSQAVAFPEQKIIVLKIIGSGDIGRSPEILLHEITHIFMGERYPNRMIPVWLNEGIAQYLSGYKITMDDKIVLANALAANNIPALQALDSLFDFSPVKARVAYLQALTAVEFIIRNHGEEALKQLVANLSATRSVNTAFKLTLGYDFLDFELYWYEDLDDKYEWLVLLNLESLIWVSIGVLAILVIIVIRVRNRRLLKEWEQNEEPFN